MNPVALDKEKILSILSTNMGSLKEFGVLEIGIFGSYAKDAANVNSDIDVLVEFESRQKNFQNYMGLKVFLEDIFSRKIDLVIREKLKARMKDQILKETIYAA